MEYIEPYKTTVLILGMMGLLSFLQLLIADITGLKGKHKPGFPIEPDYRSFLFRSVRAHANTNETLTTFVLFALFGIFSAANAQWLNNFAIAYFVGRSLHMVFYYANVSLARSVAFVLALIGLLGMFIVSLSAWL